MTAKAATPTVKTEPEAKLDKDAAGRQVKEQVIALLGKPKDLWRIDVHLYGQGRARVNVWRRENIKAQNKGGLMGALGRSDDLVETTHITDSFFVHLSETAVIEHANPPIERRYQLAS